MTTRANSQFPRPDFHRQDKQPYGLRATVGSGCYSYFFTIAKTPVGPLSFGSLVKPPLRTAQELIKDRQVSQPGVYSLAFGAKREILSRLLLCSVEVLR